jgi:hypothetical protein
VEREQRLPQGGGYSRFDRVETERFKSFTFEELHQLHKVIEDFKDLTAHGSEGS